MMQTGTAHTHESIDIRFDIIGRGLSLATMNINNLENSIASAKVVLHLTNPANICKHSCAILWSKLALQIPWKYYNLLEHIEES